MKILVQKFRVNDLIESEGKQIEFSKDNFNELVNNKSISEKISLYYRSEDELNNREIKVICRYIPDKVNYKLYQLDTNQTLKSFFLDTLHLSLQNNSEDYFTLSYLKDNKFEFSYIKHDSPIGQYFSTMKLEGKLICVNNVYNITPINKPHNRIIFGAPGTGKSHKLETELYDFPSISDEFQRSVTLEKTIKDEIQNKPAGENNGDWAASVAIKYSFYFGALDKWFATQGPGGSYNEFLNNTFGLQAKQPELMVAAYRGMNLNRKNTNTETYERVTFHPNYSYAQFVGTYKPIMKNNSDKTEIEYEFVPGPFLRTFIRACKMKVNCLLLIEEINRANVAAVFGDIFQLLDRDENGESEYPITTSEDLRKFLAKPENLGGKPVDYETISLPSNMYIWATMNSADQGVFPMDTAFKRRWEFEYIGIDDNEDKLVNDKKEPLFIPISKDGKISQKVIWNDLRKAINNKLISLGINEDKLLGPFFLSKSVLESAMDLGKDFVKLFESKILMYLFEDAAKMKVKQLFKIDNDKYIYSEVCKKFEKDGLDVFIFNNEDKVSSEAIKSETPSNGELF